MKKYKANLTTLGQGIIMGIVEVIPGVSGSTLALIMGIYDKFIDFLHQLSDLIKMAIKVITGKVSFSDLLSFLKRINYKFGGFLILGMLIGIGVFSHIMSYLLEHHPIYTNAFFFGLILASVRVPFFQIKKKTANVWTTFILSSLLFFFVLGLNPATRTTAPSLLFTFMAGFFAICAMVLPGVSGSFVLLLFGMYDYIIGLVKKLTEFNLHGSEIITLVTLGLGIIMGFAIFVRVIKYALQKFPSYLMAFLAGLMVASLRVLWPFMILSGEHGEHVTKVSPLEFPLNQTFTILTIIFVTSSIVLVLNEKMSKTKFKI